MLKPRSLSLALSLLAACGGTDDAPPPSAASSATMVGMDAGPSVAGSAGVARTAAAGSAAAARAGSNAASGSAGAGSAAMMPANAAGAGAMAEPPGSCCPDAKCLCHGAPAAALSGATGPYTPLQYDLSGVADGGSQVPTLIICGASDGVQPCSAYGSKAYSAIDASVPKMRVTIASDSDGQPSADDGNSGAYALAFQKVFLEGDLRWRPLLVGAKSDETTIK